MATTIYEVLDELRSQSLDERDKGDKFERLVKAYALNDPEWKARFDHVWLWSEWPGRDGRPDTGIDLVAKNRDSDDFTAIQCKFFMPGSTVSKGDIDSFLSASASKEFSARYIFDTARSWSPNATDTLSRQAVPVQRIDIAYLDESAFDWSQYSWATPEVLVSTGTNALRPHQERALENVVNGFLSHDRGKLIMACGTGKTFTSLKIAEELVGAGGAVLFLVPSIQLLSQSLREWMANSEVEIRPFAVCSDVRVGRRVNSDDADMTTIDLTEPATTDAGKLVARMSIGTHASDRMTVVFSTYQSIDVIKEAQSLGLPDFDLVICDEAHRTTGVTIADADESAFVKVHDNKYVGATKRLYMTATPRVFSDEVNRKAKEADAKPVSMDNEDWYGPEFHRLGFGDAVEATLLTDYKVLVLAVDEDYVAENFQSAMAIGGEIALGDAAKLIGCWNGLSKHYGSANEEVSDGGSPLPMRRAVAFAKDIKASKTAALSFPSLVDRALQDESGTGPTNRLQVEAAHVDGTMGIHERNAHLAWLKEDTPSDVCRILSNARCLSEGVDVPTLDAVLFLTPRGSQVDVVQSVGRVMRTAPGKELGYIILPIVIPSGLTPEEALKDNERYKVVWQVLQALRSHDDRFHAMVNQIELNKGKSARLVIDNVTPREEVLNEKNGIANPGDAEKGALDQLALDYAFDGFRDAMYARIVQKVGERTYWADWAKSVSDIAQAHITRINGLLADEDSSQAAEFKVFLDGLRGNLNDNITRAEAVEMLAQHLVTRPIFQALFDGYDFTLNNPVARTMELMLASLDEHNLAAENVALEAFYDSVRRRVEGVNNAEGKQRILIELYDRFFSSAFSKTVDKLGIVYTPVEIVDFILRSADDVLRAEFGQGLTDEGVHVLDGFTGTGTFMVRLLQSGLIEPHDLARKYAEELHANEILLLAYYIAAVNIETTYADLTGNAASFPGLILTDTFQSWEPDDRPDLDVFPENNARLEHLKTLPITVIVGNPPYSIGQGSANEDNRNEKYPHLDDEIRDSYAARSTSTALRGLYDSYVRALKWASLRVRDRGVIAYVTNGSFIDAASFDGLRKSLLDEFSDIYIYNLRGNRRMGGSEGRPILEAFNKGKGGSITTLAVVVLVRNPDKTRVGEPARLTYSQVADDLTAIEKVEALVHDRSVLSSSSDVIVPNEHGDWINQRGDDFDRYIPITGDGGVFQLTSGGLTTNRDAWVTNSGRQPLTKQVELTIETYNQSLNEAETDVTRDEHRISWSRGLLARRKNGKPFAFEPSLIRSEAYRPFFKTHVYFSRDLIEDRRQMPSIFPVAEVPNLGFYVVGGGTGSPFSALMVDLLPDLQLLSNGKFASRWTYEKVSDSGMLDLHTEGETVAGYRRIDNITDVSLQRFRAMYGAQITKDDIFFYIYGLLHSQAYRTTYSADLRKVLPRIPLVREFTTHVEAGRALSGLHVGYETVTPFPLGGLDVTPSGGDPWKFFAVGDRKMSFGRPTPEQKAAGERYDRTTINFNGGIALTGIPLDAYRYLIGSRSAIEWIIDRYLVKTDKASGIVNDPNDWSREIGDPRYVLDLLARIVTVSVETMKIVDALPPLDILDD